MHSRATNEPQVWNDIFITSSNFSLLTSQFSIVALVAPQKAKPKKHIVSPSLGRSSRRWDGARTRTEPSVGFRWRARENWTNFRKKKRASLVSEYLYCLTIRKFHKFLKKEAPRSFPRAGDGRLIKSTRRSILTRFTALLDACARTTNKTQKQTNEQHGQGC